MEFLVVELLYYKSTRNRNNSAVTELPLTGHCVNELCRLSHIPAYLGRHYCCGTWYYTAPSRSKPLSTAYNNQRIAKSSIQLMLRMLQRVNVSHSTSL